MISRICISENKIAQLLNNSGDKIKINEILDKALELKGLELEESAILLNINDDKILHELFKTAKKVKESIYGSRIVLFAPLYLNNYCTNNCLYCGFRVENKEIERKKLSINEAIKETKAIINTGHKRILLVEGETSSNGDMDYLEQVIGKIYDLKVSNGEIRRVNINIAPLDIDGFKRLASFNIGTYQCFQETYHRKTYEIMHPSGKKSNYDWRLETMDRALEAGLNDVGMGVLFGLTDYRFDTLALLMHAKRLDEKYGTGPHTLSIPRLEPAKGSDVSMNPPFAISDKEFKKIVAVLRLSVPYTGIILSTRERADFRSEVIELGVSQISAGSKTNPGGYSSKNATEQFAVGDTRSLDEVIYELCQNKYIPSFCTGCYRSGRVGKDFMDLAKPGLIKRFCEPNAMLTFKEYLEDYASSETKETGLEVINSHFQEITDNKLKSRLQNQLSRIDQGERDIYI